MINKNVSQKTIFIASPIDKSHEKRINITAYGKEYQRNIARVNSPQGRYMKAKRQSTVEPDIRYINLTYGT